MKKIKIISLDEIFDVPIDFDVTTQSKLDAVRTVNSTIECASGQIKHYTFETLKQRINVGYKYEAKEVPIRERKKLPCFSIDGRCKTTTFNSFAYTWDTLENCTMTKILTERKRFTLSIDN